MVYRPLSALAALFLLAGCAGHAGDRSGATFDARQLAKNDIDRVCEAHRNELSKGLRRLAEKLYRRNPRELKKSVPQTTDAALDRLFDSRYQWHFQELDGRYGSDAIQLALSDGYRGDRVFALIGGIGGMLHAAFNGKEAFFMTDDLDPQKLYNAARNLEIALWKLSNDKAGDGQLFLLSNESGPPANLSFEREFGKMIGNLDILSDIISDKSSRTVVKVLQSVASAVFLPVALLK